MGLWGGGPWSSGSAPWRGDSFSDSRTEDAEPGGFTFDFISESLKDVVDVVVDTLEHIDGAVADAAKDAADVVVDVGKGVWDIHETVVDYAADVAEAVFPVVDAAGRGTSWDGLGTDLTDGIAPDPVAAHDSDWMKAFVDRLDLTDEQRETYEEQFSERAPTDAERIEDLEKQLEDREKELDELLDVRDELEDAERDNRHLEAEVEGLEDQLDEMQERPDDVLVGDAVDGGPVSESDADAETDSGDLGLDSDLGVEQADGLDQIEEPGEADISAELDSTDDVGDTIGGVVEPEPDFESAVEPEPVVDTFDQQADAAESVESSVDGMFDGG